MLPNADVLVVNDRLLDAQETLVAIEHVAPRARALHLDSSEETLHYLFSLRDFSARPAIMPHLLFLSLEMKVISGLCVLDLVRAHPLTCEVPVVLLSLEGDCRRYRRYDRFDADAYVVRPCAFERHCAVVEGCIARWLPWALRPGGMPPRAREATTSQRELCG